MGHKFKVGDKVIPFQDTDSAIYGGLYGQIGVIYGLPVPDSEDRFVVVIDGSSWFIHPNDLRLASPLDELL